MTHQETEDLYIRSLDTPLSAAEKEILSHALQGDAALTKRLASYKKIRELATPEAPASFGYYFATRLVSKMQNSGVVIDRQIFTFFKKFQLVATGVVVALLILNSVFSEQLSVSSIFGLDDTTTVTEIVSFNFYDTLK